MPSPKVPKLGRPRRGDVRPTFKQHSAHKRKHAWELFYKHCQEAADHLLATMRDANNPPPVRLKAASEILDRGLGKPAQTVEVKSDGTDPAGVKTALAEKLLSLIERATAGDGARLVNPKVIEGGKG